MSLKSVEANDLISKWKSIIVYKKLSSDRLMLKIIWKWIDFSKIVGCSGLADSMKLT